MMPSSPKRPCRALKATSGLELGQHIGDVAIDIDAGDAKAFGFERLGAGLARAQRNLPLRREPAHQHRDMSFHLLVSSPMRWTDSFRAASLGDRATDKSA